MNKEAILRKGVNLLPANLRFFAKEAYRRRRHWGHPDLKNFGTVQDLYYWVADGDLDTLLPLQNHFSVFYPELDTATEGSITIYSKDGEFIGVKTFSLPHLGGAKFRVSSILEELALQDLAVSPQDRFGTLEVHIEIPRDVLKNIQPQKSFYFWDRFYIAYLNASGQISFVHGVDKTNIYRDGDPTATPWYELPGQHSWAPETPVDIDHYKKYSVIMINRTTRSSDMTLTFSDHLDNSLSWNANIPPRGVHRFEIAPEATAGLAPTELRMRVDGMASQWGRPVVFKEFHNGAFSAVHC